MLWKGFWIVSAVVLVCLAAAQSVNLAEEPGLQKPITVWLKMEPMRDALREIARQTGVPLRCQDAIQYEKVVIFVHKRPAHEILTQLARTFRYEWRKHEQGGYLLYVPDETRHKEEKAIRANREMRQRAFQDLVAAAREVARMTPEQHQAELERLQEKVQQQTATPQELIRHQVLAAWTPQNSDMRTDSGGSIAYKYASPELLVYHCFAAMPDAAVQALLQGRSVGFSTQPAPGIYPLPAGARFPEHMRDYVIGGDEGELVLRYSDQDPALRGIWIRLSPILGIVKFRLAALQSRQISSRNVQENENSTRLTLQGWSSTFTYHVLPYLKATSFWQEWEAWATPRKQLEEQFPDMPRAASPDRPEPKIPAYHSDFRIESRAITSADALEWLAWGTGYPLIGDAFRTQGVYPQSRAMLRNPKALVSELSHSLWLRLDETGYLLARHHLYWTRRHLEIPEHLLRPLERKHEQEKWLSLEDYINFAGQLTDSQVEYLLEGRYFGYVLYPLTRFEFEPMVDALPALRFLSALSTLQRRQALSGEWFPVRMLTMPQQRRFAELFVENFPPNERLFREIPVDNIEKVQDVPVIRLRWWRFGGVESSTNSPEIPPEPSFRTSFPPEYLVPFIVNELGDIRTIFRSMPKSGNEWIFARIREDLEKSPTSRLMAARVRAVLMEFVQSADQRKVFVLAQSQYEPYQLPESAKK